MAIPKWAAGKSTAPALVVAVLLVQSLYVRWIPADALADPLLLCSAIVVAVLGGIVLRGPVHWVAGRLAVHPARHRLALLCAFAFAGWLLTWAIPVPPAPQGMIKLEIEATGAKAAQAQSSEVWVRLQRDGVSIPPAELAHDGNWHADGEFLVSVPGRQPASLQWKGLPGGHVQLVMVTHPWSGHVRVAADGTHRLMDLYSASGGSAKVDVSGGAPTDDQLTYPPRSSLQHWVQLVDGAVIGFGMLAVFLLLSSRVESRGTNPSESIGLGRETVLHALPTLVIGLALLALYYPGLMTSDSLDQWSQASSGKYNDAHPLLYALLMRGAQALVQGPSLVAALQCLAIGLASGWLLALTRRALSANFAVAHLGAWLIAVHPMVAVTNITLWKDVPYTAAVLVIAGYLIGSVFLRCPDLRHPLTLLGLAAAVIACMLLRHNGPPVALTALIVIWLVAADVRKQVLVVAALSVFGFWAVKGPIASSLSVQSMNLQYALYAHHIGAHLAHGTVVDVEDRAWLSTLKPLEKWDYTCSLVNPTIHNEFNASRASDKHEQLRAIWMKLAASNPSVEISHLLCASGLVWRFTGGEGSPLYLYKTALYWDSNVVRWIIDRDPTLQEDSVADGAAQVVGKAILGVQSDLIWRPAGFLFLLTFSASLAAYRRRDWRWLLIPAIAILHSGVLVVLSVAQDARYQLPVYVMALLLTPVLATPRGWSLVETEGDQDTSGK